MRKVRPYSHNRMSVTVRLESEPCTSIKEHLPSRFLDSFSGLVEDLLINYNNALSYYVKSKPSWDSIIKQYPQNIAPIAMAYHPALQYQFADPKIHCQTPHGYYLRLRSFSIINSVPSISAELFLPGRTSVPVQNLATHDLAPIYCTADFATSDIWETENVNAKKH